VTFGCCGCAHCLLNPAATRAGYREFRQRYRAMATSLSFEGNMQWAEAMV